MIVKTSLIEASSQHGLRYSQKYQRYKQHWRSHIDNSRRFIMEGARELSHGTATILGVSDAKDIPIEDLARHFDTINLVDIDAESLSRVTATIEPPLRDKLRTHVLDITAGCVSQLTERSAEIINDANSPRRAHRQLAKLYEDTVPNRHLQHYRALKADYVVSSVVASQLMPVADRWIGRRYEQKFGQALGAAASDAYLQSINNLSERLVDQHAALLEYLCLPGGKVYWSLDTHQEVVIGQLPQSVVQTLGEQCAEYLAAHDWPDLLSRDAKLQLADKLLSQGDKPNIEQVETDLISCTDRLLSAFGSVSSEDDLRGRITAAITFMVGKQSLAPKQEVDFIRFFVEAAQSLSPQAVKPLLNKSFAQYFPSGLQARGNPRTWRWILDPLKYYQGGVHRVEAVLLQAEGDGAR